MNVGPASRAVYLAVGILIALALMGCEQSAEQGQMVDDGATAGSEGRGTKAVAEGSQLEEMTLPDGTDPGVDDLREVKLWFMAGEQFLPVERTVALQDHEPGAAVGPLEATQALLEGPQPSDEPVPQDHTVKPVSPEEATTVIPAGTEVVDVEVAENGMAVVELNARFMEEIPLRGKDRSAADRRALSARVGQLVHTVTQFAGISSAEIRTGGMVVAKSSRRADYAPPRPPKRSVPDTLRPGAERSPATRRLQLRLADLGYLPKGAADGIYGDQTAQAVMAFQAWQGLDRDGIAGPATHRSFTKAKRPRPQGEGPRRRIEIHLDKGLVLLVRGGRTVRAIHASGGAPGYDTPRGTYEVFRKEQMSWSVPYSVWMPYASYFNGGIALHESASVPAYPASHGCVRVPPSESKLVYNFATLGTPVQVF